MPTNPSPTEEEWFSLDDPLALSTYNNQLESAVKKYVGGKRVVTKKPVAPTIELPETVAELKKYCKDQDDMIKFLNGQVAHLEKEWNSINTKYRDVILRTHNLPDMDEMVQAVQVYCKMHKLNHKPRKDRNILNAFIAALEYKDVPIGDDALVD